MALRAKMNKFLSAMRVFNLKLNDSAPVELNGGGRFVLSRDTYVNVMDQYYPAHKAEAEPRFAEINCRISGDEFCSALELASSVGLWCFDARWRHVIPHGAPVWLPRMQRLANTT